MLESRQDKINQRQVADACEAALGVVFCQTLPYAVADWLVCRSRALILICDVKCRDQIYSHTYSEGVFLAHRKWRHLNLVGAGLKLPVGVFYRFKDGIFYLAMRKIVNPKTELLGRLDRGLAHDIEPIILAPIGKMVPLDKLRAPVVSANHVWADCVSPNAGAGTT